ncbi:MAG: cytochrome c oxidase subunit II [Dehalococcoidia bacterium]
MILTVGAVVVVGVLTGLIYLAFAESVDAIAQPMTTWVPRSDNAELVHGVYRLIFILAGIVFAAIMVLTLVVSILYRERPGQLARQFHGNSRLEVIWTLIPVLIVVAISVPTFSAMAATSKPAPDDALKVIAIGHQWWWEFQYPEQGITTANELHLPVGRPVSITLTSKDVIHSFWVPQLSGKTDNVPGHDNHLWFTPTEARPEPYLGQCAEFCGLSHANMRFRVFVSTQGDFDAWTKATAAPRTAPTADLAKAGEQQFVASGCVGCHAVQGQAAAVGKIGPDLTHFASRTTLGSGIMDNNPDNLRRWLSDLDSVKPGTVMGEFLKGQPLSKDALDKLVAYLEGLK